MSQRKELATAKSRRIGLKDKITRLLQEESVFLQIAKIPEKYVGITEAQRDFGFRVAVEPGVSIPKLTREFQISHSTIDVWKRNPLIRKLIDEVRRDMRQYMVAASALLLKDAAMAYHDILTSPNQSADAMATKRMAAKDIFDFYAPGRFTAPLSAGQQDETNLHRESADPVDDDTAQLLAEIAEAQRVEREVQDIGDKRRVAKST